jgi:hypothetical protein
MVHALTRTSANGIIRVFELVNVTASILIREVVENRLKVQVRSQIVRITSNKFFRCLLSNFIFDPFRHLWIGCRQIRQGVRIRGRKELSQSAGIKTME